MKRISERLSVEVTRDKVVLYITTEHQTRREYLSYADAYLLLLHLQGHVDKLADAWEADVKRRDQEKE